ncbi:MAG: four helix bundle protein [Gammaproteobacteria bacterium]|nr:four helix bundle protein [Gammaproteobacteria bacterium]
MAGKPMRDNGIAERSFAYALRIIGLYGELERDNVGRIVGRQLLRSGTSIGANVHEAQGGQSRADFILKMSIAHKEALESAYWLRLIQNANIASADYLLDETGQIIKILSRILITAKHGGKS